MNKRKIILRSIFLYFILSICFGALNPNRVHKYKPINFENTIRNIDWYATKDSVISTEGRLPDSFKSNDFREILIYTNSKLDQYIGTINYGFDKKGNLRFIEFVFDKENDYDAYMKNFVETNYKGQEMFKEYWIWEGYIGIKDTNFSSIKQTLSIKKYLYLESND